MQAIQDRATSIEVRETLCKTVLRSLSFHYYSSGYTANFYHGCTHGCDYCYAPSLIHDGREWGSYVDVKVNSPFVLRRELHDAPLGSVFLSSASDPYQPLEAKYKMTRKCLELFLQKGFPVIVLTRSPLVLRDLDILRKFDWIRVGFSISSVSERFHEPGVVALEKRLQALEKLSEQGIVTFVSLAPIIPGIPMLDLENLFLKLRKAGVSCVSSGLLRFNGYDESKKMFEGRSSLTTEEALLGGSDTMTQVNGLAKSYRLDDTDSVFTWKEKGPAATLDTFYKNS